MSFFFISLFVIDTDWATTNFKIIKLARTGLTRGSIAFFFIRSGPPAAMLSMCDVSALCLNQNSFIRFVLVAGIWQQCGSRPACVSFEASQRVHDGGLLYVYFRGSTCRHGSALEDCESVSGRATDTHFVVCRLSRCHVPSCRVVTCRDMLS